MSIGNLRDQVEAYREIFDDLKFSSDQSRNDRSWQGYATIKRQMLATLKTIHDLEAVIARDAGDMTDEELVRELAIQAERMPDQHIEVFVAEYDRRHKTSHLRLVGGDSA